MLALDQISEYKLIKMYIKKKKKAYSYSNVENLGETVSLTSAEFH